MRKTIHILVGVIFITSMLLTASPPGVAHAATLTVDTNTDENDHSCVDDCSLRDAIELAAGGDTIDFDSSLSGQTIALTVGSTLTIDKDLTIDASGLASHVTVSGDIDSDGDADVTVFTINSGKSVTIENLWITKGYTSGNGGGIYNQGALTVVNSSFIDNSADGNGGGIFSSGALTIYTSTFSENTADNGGGIYTGDVLIQDSTLSYNSAGTDGGGIYTTGVSTVEISTFSTNYAVTSGGGIYTSGTLTVTGSTFSVNSAYNSGAGIYSSGTLTVTNSTFYGDTASNYGGGIYNGSAGTLTVTNSTFSANLASAGGGGGGGGIYSSGTFNLILYNTILANSTAGGDCVHIGDIGTASTNNLIESSTGCGTPVSTDDPGLGPLADNGGYTHTMAITASSPAFNLGSSPTCPLTDQRDQSRPSFVACDIGAYELVTAPATVTVNSTADPGDNTCNVIECTLREAIALVASGGMVNFIASLSGGPIRLASTLNIDKDLTIDGSGLASRLTLSGDTDGDGTGDVRVFHIYPGKTATFQDMRIVKGVVTGGGGGIVNYGVLTVTECELSDNSATYQGGGIWSEGTLTVTDSTISSNSTTDNCGGGIYNSLGMLTVTDSTFSANSATGGSGGGLCSAGGTLTVTGSTFSDNSADYAAGIWTSGTTTVTDSTFSDNSADVSNGGGIYTYGTATLTVTSSTFSGNSSASNGGGIYTVYSSTVTNSTFSGNSADDSGGGIYNISGTLTVYTSTFSANSAVTSGGGIYTTGTLNLANAILANSTAGGDCDNDGSQTLNYGNLIESNSGCGTPAVTSDPDLGPLADNGGPTYTMALHYDSPAVDAGYDPYCVEPYDQRGVARPHGSHCDIGAYEFDNDAPTDISLSPSSVLESQPSGTLVGTLSATDLNPGDTPTFSFTCDTPGADDASFSLSGTLSETLNTAEIFNYEAKNLYTICIRADDGNGGTLDENFDITVTDVTGVELITPVNMQALLHNRPLFDWDDYAGASGYTIQISRNIAFTLLVTNKIVTPSTYTPTADLPANLELYWRVQARKSSGGTSNWSEVRSLKTALPPSIPNLLLPANNALTTNYKPTLDWAASTAPPYTTLSNYHLQVAVNPGFTSMLVNQDVGDHQYTFGTDLASNTTHYWRVWAEGSGGNSSPSPTRTLRTAMLPPVLSKPDDTEPTHTRRPTFEWLAVTGASGYTLQVSSSGAFITLAATYTITTPVTSYTPAADLPASSTLHWRLRANGANGPSAYSTSRSFSTGNPPGVPSLLSPLTNALLTNYTPTLDWAAVSVPAGTDFHGYEVQWDDNAAFSTPDGTDTPDHQVPVMPALDPNTKYYWRVRSWNEGGDYSGWSLVRNFRTALTPPLLTGPAGTSYTRRPTYEWSAVTGATGYTLQLASTKWFTTILATYTITTPATSYTPTTDLPASVERCWHLRANGANGPSKYSMYLCFTTGNPPSIPTLLAPANNALTTVYTPTLDWAVVSVPAGTTFMDYELQVDDSAAFSIPLVFEIGIGGLTNHEWTLTTDLDPNTKYYWRVRSFNTLSEYSAWSLVRTFRTAMLPPVLILPGDTDDTHTRRPAFDWDDVASATGYTLQVSSSGAFTTLVATYTTTMGASSYTPTADLPADTTLYWRVKTNGANGPSDYSAVRSFITGNPPSVPSLLTPALNALITDYTPLLDWAVVTVPALTTFDHYQVQVDDSADFSTSPISQDVSGLANHQVELATTLDPNAKYYWRVRSWNTLGDFSGWSLVRNFRTAMIAPSLDSPIGGITVGSRKPTFDWSDVTGATGYTLQVSSSSTFTTLAATYTVAYAVSTYTPTVNLPAGSLLYWRARANGPNGPSLWSGYETFYTP